MTRKSALFGFLFVLAACSAAYLPGDLGVSTASTGDTRNVTRPNTGTSSTRGDTANAGRRVGQISGPASGHCLLQECALGNLVADAVLWQAGDSGAVAAILPSRAIRGFLRGGEVLAVDLDAAVVNERMTILDLKGAEIRARLEESLRAAGGNPALFPQVSGLRYVWSPNHPPGRRLMTVEIADGKGGFASIANTRIYRVAVHVEGNPSSTRTVELTRALAAYFETKSPLPVPRPGRIVER